MVSWAVNDPRRPTSATRPGWSWCGSTRRDHVLQRDPPGTEFGHHGVAGPDLAGFPVDRFASVIPGSHSATLAKSASRSKSGVTAAVEDRVVR